MKIINQANIPDTNNACSNLFNSKRWLNVVSKTYGIHFYAVISDDGHFMLPFCLLEDEYFESVKSIPFGDYTLNNCSQKELQTALLLLQHKYPECYIETSVVQKTPPGVKDFNAAKYGFLIQIDIQNWRETTIRQEAYERNIKNAIHNGLNVHINSNINGLEGFYNLHEQLRINKFKKLPQPFLFFTNIYEEFIASGNGFLLEAWNKDILVASWVILIHNKTLYYKLGASHPGFLHLRPNDLLFRSLMQYGSEHGYQTIDLGFSGATKSYEGLIRFKSKEGGEKEPIYRVEYYPENFDKENLIKKSKFQQGITQKALASNDLNVIRETSNRYYHRFA